MSAPADPAGHPSVASTFAESNPHYRALGGDAVISRLVNRFYDYMDTLPEAKRIRDLHPVDLSHSREVLTRYLIEWTGGPANYSKERGHPRLRKRHMPFPVGPSERDAWMLCMRSALAEVVVDERLRADLDQSFYKVADFIRNDPETPHNGPHATHVAGTLGAPIRVQGALVESGASQSATTPPDLK